MLGRCGGIRGPFRGLGGLFGKVSAFIVYLFGSMGACERLVPIETSLYKEYFVMMYLKVSSKSVRIFKNQKFAS